MGFFDDDRIQALFITIVGAEVILTIWHPDLAVKALGTLMVLVSVSIFITPLFSKTKKENTLED